ncbi:MAG: ATP-binding cassette domain-containing protein [Gammaproteobacteria bacterium]|nr:ATP-binding cassette domain-containing protein [Gammaproteobacteria bacterium]
MDNLIAVDNVSLAYGLEPLLDKVKLQITSAERVCLIGRNGTGKSSLLKIIDGSLQPDSGNIWRKPNLRIARLEQELPQKIPNTVYEYVATGLSEVGQLLAAYHTLTQHLSHTHDKKDLLKLEQLQNSIDLNHGWELEQNIKNVLDRLDLDADKPMDELSGGWQRRAALAKALVVTPELLLLDEPTNHLDIDAIQWLEEQLLNCNFSLLFITHDRSLLQHLATRIIELDRGQLTSWPGGYENFLRRKDEMLQAEARQNILFDKKLAEEEVWIRQGIKARRTRNEGRVRALKALRIERSKRREVEKRASFDINTVNRSGQLVVEAKNISHNFGKQQVIKDFSIRIMRGDRVGLIGANGSGKTTLLNILLGRQIPEHGTITRGTWLDIAYFDQLRQTLDLEKTVLGNVAHGSEFIEVNGKQRHIISYLEDFLFSAKRALTPVKALSGGECNRLLLARLFSRPANLLVLDEPTNDLDIETLELLEELLSKFKGTLLLVSHDRTFLDNIVTSVLVFEGNGRVVEYIGGYHDWQMHTKHLSKTQIAAKKISQQSIGIAAAPQNKKPSYKDQRELTELLRQIARLETEKTELESLLANPEFYKNTADIIRQNSEKLKKLESNLRYAYLRWEELESKQK